MVGTELRNNGKTLTDWSETTPYRPLETTFGKATCLVSTLNYRNFAERGNINNEAPNSGHTVTHYCGLC